MAKISSVLHVERENALLAAALSVRLDAGQNRFEPPHVGQEAAQAPAPRSIPEPARSARPEAGTTDAGPAGRHAGASTVLHVASPPAAVHPSSAAPPAAPAAAGPAAATVSPTAPGSRNSLADMADRGKDGAAHDGARPPAGPSAETTQPASGLRATPAASASAVAADTAASARAQSAAAPAAMPSGSGAEISFISGITSSGTVAGTSFWSWNYATNPATYDDDSSASKWGSSTPGTSGGTVKYWFDGSSNWTTTEKNGLASGLSLWSAEARITFALASSSGSADLIFYRGNDGTASTSPPGDSSSVGDSTEGTLGSVSITIDPSGNGFGPIGGAFSLSGGYPYETLVHEEGHMIGLGHGGPYNAGDGAGSVPSRQFGVYDTRLWTLMSYINPGDTSAKYYNSYPVTGTSWAGNNPTTPMILDILAAQRLYGAPTSGPLASGGQVFGFNCNIAGTNTDSSIHRYFDFTNNKSPVVTLWDGGTGNTLDLSGYGGPETINLQPGTFSSCNGMVNNIGIAEDTVIETAKGGSGDDTIIGSDANNVLYGNGGNDTLQGGAGQDTLNGGSGTNTASYSSSSAPVIVNLASGTGSGGDADGDTLVNIQNLTGSGGADILTGDNNANRLLGGGGADLLKGGGGADYLDGGSGNNAASYVNSSSAVSVNLQTGTGQFGEAAGDTLVNIQNVTGSDYADTLTGNASANKLYGGKGNDTLQGGAGADRLDGGDGTNTASYAGAASGVVVSLASGTGTTGDAQGDTLVNIQNLTGSNAGDILVGDGNANALLGNGGDDILKGGGGADKLDGGTGTNTASYVNSSAAVSVSLATGAGSGGEAQGDTLTNIQNLTGSSYNDFLTGDGNANALSGLDGNDTLKGGGGADRLDGGAGVNTASYFTSASAVTVNLSTGKGSGGDAQGDTLANIQNVIGSNANDSLLGDGNANSLYGEDGDDLLKGGGGADNLDGGTGTNTASYYTSTSAVTVNLSTGKGSGGDAQGDTLANIQTVLGSAYNDVLVGDGNANSLYGENGDDLLKGGGGADTLDGGAGVNTASYFTATAGVAVSLASGLGSLGDALGDMLADIQDLVGSNYGDLLIGDDGNNDLYGEDGNDTLESDGGDDNLYGGNDFDIAVFDFASTAAAITTSNGAPTAVAEGGDTIGLSSIEELEFTDLSILYGALTIAAGDTATDIEVAAGGALEDDGTLLIDTATPVVEAGPISGTGALTVAAGANVTFIAAGTYTGATTVQGTLAIGAGGSLAGTSQIALTASGALFDVSGSGGATIVALATAAGSTVKVGAATLSETAGATLSGGSLTGTAGGTLLTAGPTTTTGFVVGGAATWSNAGTVTQTGTVQIGDNSGSVATVKNLGGATWNIAGDVGFTIGPNTGSSLTNAGTLAKTDGSGISHIGASFTTTGTVSVAGGTLELDGLINSVAGTLNGPGALVFGSGVPTTVGDLGLAGGVTVSNAGTVTQSGTVTVTKGTIANAAGATWILSGGNGLALASGGTGSFTNAGTLKKTSGTSATVGVSVVDTGSVSMAGNLAFTGSANTFAGAFTGLGKLSFGGGANAFNAGTSIGTSAWTITGAGTAGTLNTALSYGGNFVLSAGALLTLNQGLTLTGPASFVGSTVIGSAALATSGATTLNGATLAGTVAWKNTGTVTATGALTLGDVAAQKATFTNAAGGTYNITGAGGIALGGGTTSVFVNSGLLQRTSGSTTVKVGVKVLDTGTVTVATGGLEFDGAGSTFAGAITGAGTVAFGSSAGATLLAGSSLSAATVSIVTGGRLNLATSLTYDGKLVEAATGVLGLGANTLTLTGMATLAGTVAGVGGTLAVSGGSLTLNAGAGLGMSTLAIGSGATVAANTGLSTQASLTESASTLVLNNHPLILGQSASFAGGTIDGAGGGTLSVKGAATLTAGLILDGGATLALYGTTTETGGLTLGDGGGGTGTLVNQAGASFSIGDDSAIAAAAGGTGKVVNAGTLTKTAGSGTSVIGPSVSNTGTIAVASGTLDLAGSVTGTGQLIVGAGTTLEIGGGVSAGSTVSFASGGSGTDLQLDKAQAFAGKVSGFGAGDALDLTNVAFSGAHLSYADTSSGGTQSGTLTVAGGGITANIRLLGTYTLANFTPAADGAATPGTLITYHA